MNEVINVTEVWRELWGKIRSYYSLFKRYYNESCQSPQFTVFIILELSSSSRFVMSYFTFSFVPIPMPCSSLSLLRFSSVTSDPGSSHSNCGLLAFLCSLTPVLPIVSLVFLFLFKVGVQGGIALTSPPCKKKKQTSGLTEKARSVYQTNCEMAVVKAAL